MSRVENKYKKLNTTNLKTPSNGMVTSNQHILEGNFDFQNQELADDSSYNSSQPLPVYSKVVPEHFIDDLNAPDLPTLEPHDSFKKAVVQLEKQMKHNKNLSLVISDGISIQKPFRYREPSHKIL